MLKRTDSFLLFSIHYSDEKSEQKSCCLSVIFVKSGPGTDLAVYTNLLINTEYKVSLV